MERRASGVVIVREWATIVRPIGRFPWVAYLLPVAAIVGIAVMGVRSALELSRGFVEIMFWVSLGVLPVVGAVIFLSRRLLAVRDKAREARNRSADSDVRLFSASAIGGGISDWRDWQRSDECGEGFLQLGPHDLRIWTARDGLERLYSWDRVAYVEDVRVWGSWMWSPQLRVCFSDGSQFIASLAHAGLASVLGFRPSDMRRLGESFDRHAPGLLARKRSA